VNERAVSELRELERRDAELAERSERLRALDGNVAGLRAQAEEIDAFFAAYPAVETRLRTALAGARRELELRQREVADAEALLGRARDDETRASARQALRRATDDVIVARERVARAAAEHEDLERRAVVLPHELPRLESRAAAFAAELDDAAPPTEGPRGLVDWSARAHASIFVATSHIDAERDRLIREANELATMLLGEPTYGATAAQARARVEAAL